MLEIFPHIDLLCYQFLHLIAIFRVPQWLCLYTFVKSNKIYSISIKIFLELTTKNTRNLFPLVINRWWWKKCIHKQSRIFFVCCIFAFSQHHKRYQFKLSTNMFFHILFYLLLCVNQHNMDTWVQLSVNNAYMKFMLYTFFHVVEFEICTSSCMVYCQ